MRISAISDIGGRHLIMATACVLDCQYTLSLNLRDKTAIHIRSIALPLRHHESTIVPHPPFPSARVPLRPSRLRPHIPLVVRSTPSPVGAPRANPGRSQSHIRVGTTPVRPPSDQPHYPHLPRRYSRRYLPPPRIINLTEWAQKNMKTIIEHRNSIILNTD